MDTRLGEEHKSRIDSVSKANPRPAVRGSIRIITYNIHSNVSPNNNNDATVVTAANIEMISKMNADVIILQEVPHPMLNILKQFFNVISTPNGLYRNIPMEKQIFIVVLTNKKAAFPVFKIIEADTIEYRNSIALTYKGVNIIATHAPIGVNLFNAMGELMPPTEFEKVYGINSSKRMRFFRWLINFRFGHDAYADIVAGDCNFLTGDPEYKLITEHYEADIEGASTIHKSRVDYVFYNPRTIRHLSTSVIPWNESDHRPVIFDGVLRN